VVMAMVSATGTKKMAARTHPANPRMLMSVTATHSSPLKYSLTLLSLTDPTAKPRMTDRRVGKRRKERV
jgi:hypothetical protein